VVQKVHPPKCPTDQLRPEPEASSSTTPASAMSPVSDEELPVHKVGGDLKIPTKDAVAQDDPTRYFYWVRIMELEKERSHEKGKAAAKALIQSGELLTGSLMEVQCGVMRCVSSPDTHLTNI